MDRYAVMGNPIKHSKSPQIHKAFAEQTDQQLTYTSLLVELDGFQKAVKTFQREGGKGLNITVPFKLQAYDFADELSERATLAKAVNTFIFEKDGIIRGDNTDGVGLVRDMINNHDGRIADKRILVVGAGGAVRGVLGPLLAEKPSEIVITNRTVEKALQLAEDFSAYGPIKGEAFSWLKGEFDWIINGTAASLQGEVPPLHESIITNKTCCYDMMYSKETTAFNQWALNHGAAFACDGIGMLVEQAAESFRLWRGVMPATQSVISELKAAS
ncbi:MAG: shikimate dehydrogenase [Gammaproteobacteria bacterium]|nr:MAG: shikimate dehydrogenase [Gammaproteobacteria bacterium]